MISAIVFVSDVKRRDADEDREMLVRSLVWLVSAVVSGIVKDVTLAGSAELGLSEIADQSGCGIVEGETEAERLTKAVAVSKYPRLLFLESAYQPAEGMIAEMDRISRVLPLDTTARILATPDTFWRRLFPDQAETVGLLAPAARCRALAGRDFAKLKAGLKPKALFATRANPIF